MLLLLPFDQFVSWHFATHVVPATLIISMLYFICCKIPKSVEAEERLGEMGYIDTAVSENKNKATQVVENLYIHHFK